jgi:hypothetical protein
VEPTKISHSRCLSTSTPTYCHGASCETNNAKPTPKYTHVLHNHDLPEPTLRKDHHYSTSTTTIAATFCISHAPTAVRCKGKNCKTWTDHITRASYETQATTPTGRQIGKCFGRKCNTSTSTAKHTFCYTFKPTSVDCTSHRCKSSTVDTATVSCETHHSQKPIWTARPLTPHRLASASRYDCDYKTTTVCSCGHSNSSSTKLSLSVPTSSALTPPASSYHPKPQLSSLVPSPVQSNNRSLSAECKTQPSTFSQQVPTPPISTPCASCSVITLPPRPTPVSKLEPSPSIRSLPLTSASSLSSANSSTWADISSSLESLLVSMPKSTPESTPCSSCSDHQSTVVYTIQISRTTTKKITIYPTTTVQYVKPSALPAPPASIISSPPAFISSVLAPPALSFPVPAIPSSLAPAAPVQSSEPSFAPTQSPSAPTSIVQRISDGQVQFSVSSATPSKNISVITFTVTVEPSSEPSSTTRKST